MFIISREYKAEDLFIIFRPEIIEEAETAIKEYFKDHYFVINHFLVIGDDSR